MKFEYFNPNPDAQTFKSGKPKSWGRDDSCVRALCCAKNKDWQTIFTDLTNLAKQYNDMPHSKEVFNSYSTVNGFTHITFGKPTLGEKRPTVSEFADKNSNGIYILYLRDYYVCVKDGVIYNTIDVGKESVYSYWKLAK